MVAGSRYVAQDSLQPLDDQQSCKIVHRTIVNFFTGYSPTARR